MARTLFIIVIFKAKGFYLSLYYTELQNDSEANFMSYVENV